MIKIDKQNNCKSYWRGPDVYDLTREYSFTIKIFGLTVWKKSDNLKRELLDLFNDSGVGFRKK